MKSTRLGVLLACAALACTETTAPDETAAPLLTTPAVIATGYGVSNLSSTYSHRIGQTTKVWAGGLYELGGNATNTPPAAHLANAITPPANPTIVTMAMSNLLRIEDSLVQHIPGLIRCSAGGQASAEVADSTNPIWAACDAVVADPNAVALVLAIPTNKNPSNALGSSASWNYTDVARLRVNVCAMARHVRARWPNAVVGLVSRAYAPPGASPLSPEPYAEQSGLAARFALWHQYGITSPDCGTDKAAPLFWAAHNWNPTDPLTWYEGDGVHPSLEGRGVRARQIVDGLCASAFVPWVASVVNCGSPPMPNATWVQTGVVCGAGFCDVAGLFNGQPRTVRVQ